MNLNPCPHCQKTELDHDTHTMEPAVEYKHYADGNAHLVQCNWCGLSGPLFGTYDEAVEAWNNLPRNPSQLNAISESKTI